MKNYILNLLTFGLVAVALAGAQAQEINVGKEINVLGMTKPIPVALSGFSGVGEEVLKFDLTVQGFSFVAPDAAQYLITGRDAGDIAGSLTDKVANKVILSRSYNGASRRRQAHAFADDIVEAVTGKKGIGQTKIAFKSQPKGIGPGEIYVSDFDGYNAQAITSDNAIVAKPAWVPGRLALYYTSYARGNPDIFYHDLSTGQRRVIAGYSGLNTSASVSPDGSKVAMVLDKTGTVNIWVCDADGSNLKRITRGVEDSSPTWSPDGQWICFATKENSRRRLAKVSSSGGPVHYLNTAGVANPTEPDWSPDGKLIAFTSQMGDFNICVIPADGSQPPAVLATGQNPSWSPNSRTLAFNHAIGYREVLSVLDVFTKQYKDCMRVPGSSSQPAWAK
ncbi:MAG TPA: LpqB family beta-propeller domain-containing protein [Candidatus Binatia bacterium]|nr:LpqB family beta-propeller domain-containing protein [Candidatus Binatia bacterium]